MGEGPINGENILKGGGITIYDLLSGLVEEIGHHVLFLCYNRSEWRKERNNGKNVCH